MDDPAYPDALAAQYKLHWYLMEHVLGQGGFGITYLARDSNLDKLVAIKEYLPMDTATRRADSSVSPRAQTQSERYGAGLEGFIREARTLARFSHPNIVRVHSVFQHNNTAYMVMEFEEGETLAALLDRRQTLPEGELLDIILPVLDGLALVHAAGFIHRDIKPENILVRTDKSPVLLDFGSARAALGQSRTLTILVAPGYAPYEQYYANSDSQGPWTDIYSLGATCYRAITGVAPMDAIQRSKGVLGSTREMLAPASERGARRYSAPFLQAVDHALAFAERDRPQTLDTWRKELTGGVVTAAAPAPAKQQADAQSAPVVRSGASRREMALWAAVGAAVAGVGLMLWPRSPAPEAGRLAQIEQQLRAVAAAGASAPVPPAPLAPSALVVASTAASASTAPAVPAPALVMVPVGKAVPAAKPAAQTLPAAAPKPVPKPAAALAPVARSDSSSQAAAPLPVAVSTPTVSPVPAPSPAPVPPSGPAPVAAAVAPAAPAPAPAAPVAIAPAAAPVPLAREEAKPVAAAKAAEVTAPSDEKEAFAFHRARALKGDQDARVQLGEMYAQGKGVAQNPNQAYLWFGLAARSGHAAARARQAQVAERLQPAERRQLDRQIEQLTKTAE